MQKQTQNFRIRIRQIFTRSKKRSETDTEKLRSSAQKVLRKYHKTFRKLANE